MSKWKSMDDAPHDRAIILDVGLPWSVVGHFNCLCDKFVYANLQMGFCDGDFKDVYFENDYEQSPKGWQELPKTKK